MGVSPPPGCEEQCDRVSLYRYNAVLSCIEDEFQGSETIQIITGLKYDQKLCRVKTFFDAISALFA